jgi:hypothetical protein
MSTSGRAATLNTTDRRTAASDSNAAPSRAADSPDTVDLVCCSLHEIARLREENETLRQSALAFGALAERLHLALQRERLALSAGAPDDRASEEAH